MSELIAYRTSNGRVALLATVSLLALSSVAAAAEEGDPPSVWIELGAQLERIDGSQAPFDPAFLSPMPSFITTTPVELQRPARYGIGGEGKLSFQPEGSDWMFSAAVRYGRANGQKYLHEQTPGQNITIHIGSAVLQTVAPYQRFAETRTSNKESHTFLDFQVGKDVGLGFLGRHTTSNFGFGVRFAQFTSKTAAHMSVETNLSFPSTILGTKYKTIFSFEGSSERSFHGLGPSLSWNGSADLLRGADDAAVTFDWAVNGAILFGRQKADVDGITVGRHTTGNLIGRPVTVQTNPPPLNASRSRSVTVPNLGGSGGISFRFPNAKVSVGYRIDYFFGAMDGGIATAKSYDRSFHGPYATISVGL